MSSARQAIEPPLVKERSPETQAAWRELCRWLLIDDDDAAIVAPKARRVQDAPAKPIASEEHRG